MDEIDIDEKDWFEPLVGINNTSKKSNRSIEEYNQRFNCNFDICKLREWFPGYITRHDLWMHQQLHRCQWLRWTPGDLYTQCTYIPSSNDDLKLHVDEHVLIDVLPTKRYQSSFIMRNMNQSGTYMWKGLNTMSDHD